MDPIEAQVIESIKSVLAGRGHPDVIIDMNSSLNAPTAWDSLAFVEIFMTVSANFGLDLSDDDAMNFMSVSAIVDFIRSQK